MRETIDSGPQLTQMAASFERLFELLRRLTPEPASLTAASTLHRLDRSGDHRLSNLAVAEGVTQPGMTQLVSRLERDGLVERMSDPADGRVVMVRITDQGRALVHRRRQARHERLGALLAKLSPEERAAITAALPALDHLSTLAAHQTAG